MLMNPDDEPEFRAICDRAMKTLAGALPEGLKACVVIFDEEHGPHGHRMATLSTVPPDRAWRVLTHVVVERMKEETASLLAAGAAKAKGPLQ